MAWVFVERPDGDNLHLQFDTIPREGETFVFFGDEPTTYRISRVVWSAGAYAKQAKIKIVLTIPYP